MRAFDVIYDIRDAGNLLPGAELFGVLIASFVYFVLSRRGWTKMGVHAKSVATLLLFAAIFATGYLSWKRLHYARLLDRQQVETIEGGAFVQSVWAGHVCKGEALKIGGAEFHYSDYVSTAGFHNANCLGGPLHSGDHLKVRHLDGNILRIERRH